MLRYHKQLYFPQEDKQTLLKLVEHLNGAKFAFSKHSIERIQEKTSIEEVGYFLRDLKLSFENLFEYYKEGEHINKVCFRYALNQNEDVIIVLNDLKYLVTVFINKKSDNHITLNPLNYCTK